MLSGLHILGATIGSRYASTGTAGDGSAITAGSRVRYAPGKHSIFDYDEPQPKDGSVGRVVGDFYEFNKQMWAKVAIDGQSNALNPMDGTWNIRTRDLRDPDAAAPSSRTASPPAQAPPATESHRRFAIGARPFFFVTAALAVALVIIGGRP